MTGWLVGPAANQWENCFRPRFLSSVYFIAIMAPTGSVVGPHWSPRKYYFSIRPRLQFVGVVWYLKNLEEADKRGNRQQLS